MKIMWEQKNYWIEHSSDLNKEERPERKPKNRWRNKSETTQEGQKVLNVGCGIGGGDFYMSQNFDVSCRWLCHWTSTARLSLRLRIAPQKKKTYPDNSFDVIYSDDTILHIQVSKLHLNSEFSEYIKQRGYDLHMFKHMGRFVFLFVSKPFSITPIPVTQIFNESSIYTFLKPRR